MNKDMHSLEYLYGLKPEIIKVRWSAVAYLSVLADKVNLTESLLSKLLDEPYSTRDMGRVNAVMEAQEQANQEIREVM